VTAVTRNPAAVPAAPGLTVAGADASKLIWREAIAKKK